MPGHFRRPMVVDVIERIGAAGVFREGVVVEVEAARLRIDRHVFHDGAEPARTGVNLRFGLGGEANDLGVTAVLEVEDASKLARAVCKYPVSATSTRSKVGCRSTST